MLRMGTARSAMRFSPPHWKENNLQRGEEMREPSVCAQHPCSPVVVPEVSMAVPGIPPAPLPCSASLQSCSASLNQAWDGASMQRRRCQMGQRAEKYQCNR